MTKTACALATALLIGGSTALSAPASAQVARGATALAQPQESAVQTVQWRRWHHHRHYRHRHHGWGPAIGGFAAGAIIGGAIASQQAQAAQQDWLAYCSAKYRSFDPATGTYTTYSGEQRYCQ